MFVTADFEDATRKILRRAQNGIKCEGGKRKTKEWVKISDNHVFKMIFDRNV
jgi:hypothetical protein